MALSDILQEIRQEAGRKADRIRERSRRDAEAMLADTRREAERTKAAIVERNAKKLNEELARDMSRARLQARKEILSMKRGLVAGLFERIPDLLLEKPAAEYAALLAGFIGRDALALPAELQTGTREVERYGKGFPGLLAGLLKEKHPGARLEPAAEPGPFSQGTIIRSGRVVHNLSFDSLIAEARPRTEVEAARILFSQ